MNPSNTRCLMPGCTGSIDEGYCNVCGSPVGAAPPPPVSPTQEVSGTARTSSSRLAAQALGSARIGSGRTRRLSTSATRLRVQRMGAGLTTVPPTPTVDPLAAVMGNPVVPEHKRVCSSCSNRVGQSHDGSQGRTDGFCPTCGSRFDFRPTLLPGDLVGGQYQVVGCLAHGGQGWIYLAQDRNVSDRWVVLKGLLNSNDPDAVAAAIAERQFLAEVDHPLIVEIYNFATFGGVGYIVMGYVGGTSLKSILAERNARAGQVDPLPVDQALAYVLEILPAFSYLHDQGLLYCDFKPDNLLSHGETVKLIDLGGVRRADDDHSPIFGTVGFQAPEVAVDGPSVASDVFTIGRTLATMVLDFRGNTSTYATTLPPVAETPLFTRYDSFHRLLAKACAPDPNDRFATVDELRVQMLGVLREVVALDRGQGTAARSTTTSALFAAPTVDAADPLQPSELPLLRLDEHDPMAGWLSGVTLTDLAARFASLSAPPQTTAEVLLARAQTALAAASSELATATEWANHARQAIEDLLRLDPWDWRAAWLSGLLELTRGAWPPELHGVRTEAEHAKVMASATVAARASFNAVYGQVPGELAPKLALATCCELSGEDALAESLYLVCASADANYTSVAAFGLARIRLRRDDLDAALEALAMVSPTRGSYAQAQMMRARLLAGSGRGLAELARALEDLDRLPISSLSKAKLQLDVMKTALTTVTTPGVPPAPTLTIGGHPATEPGLRDGAEQACRDLARLTVEPAARFALVDEANRLRRWTVR